MKHSISLLLIVHSYARLLSFLACICLISTDTYPQRPAKPDNNEKEKVQASSKAALARAEQGDLNGSLDILNMHLSQIPKTRANDPHIAFLHFNLGYIFNHYGPYGYDNYLTQAIYHYRRALEKQPQDLKTMNNLAILLEQNGEYDSTLLLLRMMIKREPTNEGVYLTTMGDVFRAQGDFENAWMSYRQALLSENPPLSTGVKIIDLYNEYPASSIDELYRQCLEFESKGFPELAKPGYESILSQEHSYAAVLDPKLMEEIVLRWIATTIQLDYASPDLLSAAELDAVALVPLNELKLQTGVWNSQKDPGSNSNQLIWWREAPRRHFYFLAFEKSFADHLMNDGNAEYAIQLYEQVLDQLWTIQDFSREIYGREDALMTELVILLARIYNNPKFRNEDKWKNLEDHILMEKGSAFRTNNLANRQKFHTILGQIYLERGEFSGYGYRNAAFQLQNAIDVSILRAKEDPFTYYPIPNLYLLLGAMHDTLNNEKAAYDAYVNAALGYLESDNLRQSGEMIKIASSRNIEDQFNSIKFSAVESIYTTRMRIPELDKSDFDKAQRTYYQKDTTFAWLTDKSVKNVISSEIVERQRFKILSDLSARAAKVDATDESAKLSENARNSAKNVEVMTSRQDVIRLRDLDTEDKSNPEKKEESYRLPTYSTKRAEEVIIDQKAREYSKSDRIRAGGG